MARTIDYWHQYILTAKSGKPELAALNSTSKTAIFNHFAYVVAVVIAALDNLFDLHKQEVSNRISLEKAHRLQWYRDKALSFRYGQNLIPESDQYDNTGLTENEIQERLIVKQSAVTEVDGRIRIKVVTEENGEYVQLDADQRAAFKQYINKVKDGGVKIIDESLPPDQLKLSIDVWYNPLVLRGDGSRVDGSDPAPVAKALRAFLKNLPFNGEYANTRLSDALQKVDGVDLVNVKSCQAKYGLFPFTSVDEKYIPDAGYLELTDENLTINYREYVQY